MEFMANEGLLQLADLSLYTISVFSFVAALLRLIFFSIGFNYIPISLFRESESINTVFLKFGTYTDANVILLLWTLCFVWIITQIFVSFKLFTEVSEREVKWLSVYIFQTFTEAIVVFIFICCFAMLSQSMLKSGEITIVEEKACSELLSGLTVYVIMLELISVWCCAIGCSFVLF